MFKKLFIKTIVVLLIAIFAFSAIEVSQFPLMLNFKIEWVKYYTKKFTPLPHYYKIGVAYPLYSIFTSKFFLVCGKFWNVTSSSFNAFIAVIDYNGSELFYKHFSEYHSFYDPVILGKEVYLKAKRGEKIYDIIVLDLRRWSLNIIKTLEHDFNLLNYKNEILILSNGCIYDLNGILLKKIEVNYSRVFAKNGKLYFLGIDNILYQLDNLKIIKMFNLSALIYPIKRLVNFKILDNVLYILALLDIEYASLISKIDLSTGKVLWKHIFKYSGVSSATPFDLEIINSRVYLTIMHEVDRPTVFAETTCYSLLMVLDDDTVN